MEEEKRSVEEISKDYDEAKKAIEHEDENKYFHNVSENERDDGRNINAILMNADEQIFNAFSQANEGITAKNKDELSQEDRQKYDEFLKSDEVGKIYDDTDKKVKNVNKDRNVRLSNAAQTIDGLRVEIDKKLNQEINPRMEEIENEIRQQVEEDKAAKQEEINAKQEEINALSGRTDKDSKKELELLNSEMKQLQGEYSKLENGTELKNRLKANSEYEKLETDKKDLERMRSELGPSKEELENQVAEARKDPNNKDKSDKEIKDELDNGLSKDLRVSLANQKDLRDKAKDKAKEIFGEDRVKDDFGRNEQNNEQVKEQGENQQVVPEESEINQPNASAAGAVHGGAPAGGAQVAGNAGVVAPGQVISDESNELTAAQMLGINDKNALNLKSSRNALKVFLGDSAGPDGRIMDDETRMKILSSPEGTILLRDLIAKTSEPDKRLIIGFFNERNNKKLNNKVIEMLENKLPNYIKERNRNVNSKDLDNVYKDLGVNDIDLDKDIFDQINNMDPEKVQEMQEKVSDLNSSYDTMAKKYQEALKDKSLSEADRKDIQDKLNNISEKKNILDKSFKSCVDLKIGTDYAKNAAKGDNRTRKNVKRRNRKDS